MEIITEMNITSKVHKAELRDLLTISPFKKEAEIANKITCSVLSTNQNTAKFEFTYNALVRINRGGDSLVDTVGGGGGWRMLSRSEFRSKPITTAGNCIRSVEMFYSTIWMFIAVFKN